MEEENKINIQQSRGSLFLVKFIPIVFAGVLGLVPLFFPGYFPWIIDIKLFVLVCLLMTLFQSVVFILTEYRGKNSFYKNTFYIWILFYAILIYLTGGLNSTFMFIMVLIPIISTSYLNDNIMKYGGITSVVFLAALIFFQPGAIHDPVLIIKHLISVSIYALMVFALYRIMKEILYHKYEEEVFKRKFIDKNELEKAKNVFSTAMSHQLRTPLTAVRWAIEEAIRDKSVTEKMLQEGEKRILSAIDILNDILKTTEFDLYDASFQLNKKPLNLNVLVKEIVANLNFLIEIKANKISYDMPEEIMISADKKMLDLALTNIIDNALKYSPKGTIKISLNKRGNQADLVVEDSGIGIETVDQKYIFQKFFRGKNALLVEPNGSGIGLYSTKKIIEMHGGEIEISSVFEQGTKVEILLPLI